MKFLMGLSLQATRYAHTLTDSTVVYCGLEIHPPALCSEIPWAVISDGQFHFMYISYAILLIILRLNSDKSFLRVMQN